MLKSLLNILIFLILSFPSYSQSVDSLVDFQTLECAMNLVSEENRNFINEAAISTIFSGWFSGSRHEILPPIPSLPALNRIRIALNNGILTDEVKEEIKYVSFTIKDNNENEYLAYGEIKDIELLPPNKDTKDIKVHIELLDGENVTLTGPDLYDIAISENSKQAFKERDITPTPEIKRNERILAPHPNGGFGYGRVMRFVGDQAEVYFEGFRQIKLAPINSIKPLLQEKDIILVQLQFTDSELEFLENNNASSSGEEEEVTQDPKSLNQENNSPFLTGERFDRDMEVSLLHNQGHNRVFFAVVVKAADDEGMIQIKTIKKPFFLYRKIHPRDIIDIQDQPVIF